MSQFTQPIESLLLNAGWYDGREIDLTDFKQLLITNGFKVSIAIERFLTEFGGLKVNFPRGNGFDTVHFDVKEAIEGVSTAWAQGYHKNKLGNKVLCIIGEAFSNHLTLMMDEEGALYGGYDQFLCFIANNGQDGIECICSDREIVEIL